MLEFKISDKHLDTYVKDRFFVSWVITFIFTVLIAYIGVIVDFIDERHDYYGFKGHLLLIGVVSFFLYFIWVRVCLWLAVTIIYTGVYHINNSELNAPFIRLETENYLLVKPTRSKKPLYVDVRFINRVSYAQDGGAMFVIFRIKNKYRRRVVIQREAFIDKESFPDFVSFLDTRGIKHGQMTIFKYRYYASLVRYAFRGNL